jgi:hypothetical protein
MVYKNVVTVYILNKSCALGRTVQTQTQARPFGVDTKSQG